MERVNPQYDQGLEMHPYQGMEIHEYGGMDVNEYRRPGGDEGEEKQAFTSANDIYVYSEDPRSRLHRDLKTRQISMIALGGALGTGLLINSGTYLQQSGPGALLIGYALVGWLCFTVMAAMGEMATWIPLASGFTGFAHRFVDPALGFALGWNYYLKYIITTPNNIIASVLVIKYWFDQRGYGDSGIAAPALYVAIILAIIIAINYFGVAFFGEFEFWLSSAKVLIMIGLIIFLLVLATKSTPGHDAPGFTYFVNPGAFAQYHAKGDLGRFLGLWTVLSSAVFSFLGTELVGVTVGEAQNPRKAIPRAVKLTFFRIVCFYMVLILLLGMTVQYNNPELLTANAKSKNTASAAASPFVVAALNQGVVSASVDAINACILVFTFSAANSDLYIATRTIYSLAMEGNAPKIFSRTNERGVPVYALALSSAFCCMAFMCQRTGVFYAFTFLVSLVTIFGILTWISILVSHIFFVRARKAQGIPDSALAFVSPFGIRGSQIALIFACVITIFNGFPDFIHDDVTGEKWDPAQFAVDYIPIPIYLIMIFGYKVFMKSEGVTPMSADLFGGKAKIDEDEAEFLEEQRRRRGGMLETRWEKYYRVTLGNFF